jgi:hypothetical protein
MKRFLFSALFLLLTAALGYAASATFWIVATQAEFLKGDATSLSIDSDGRLALGPALEQIAETSAPVLWAIIPAPDGGYFVGSGNEGKVFRIARDGKTSVLFDAGELEVHALVAAPGGGVFVGTSPDGKVYKVAPDGTSQAVFDPEDKYIWALATDSRGNLYVATGEKGVIYRVTPDGKSAAFYRTRATHALSLTFDKEGRLLAGTGSPGRVFRIDGEGRGFVLLDSPYREIRALRVAADGAIYAAALSDRPAASGGDTSNERVTPEPQRTATPSVSTEITAIAIVDTGQTSGATTTPARESRPSQPKGAIIRILSDGTYDTVWTSESDQPYDLAIDPQGQLLVATGGEGRLYRASAQTLTATLLGRVGAQQVTAMLPTTDGQYVLVTANPGKLFRLSAARAARGTYESDVRDASTVASWGTISWRAQLNGGRVDVSTRSGNTATPDETWSDWSVPYKLADGDRVLSPKARYLQWRAVLTAARSDSSPVLTSVSTAYLPRNLRPDVESITVHPSGTVFQKPFSTGELEIAGFDDPDADAKQAAASQSAGVQAAPLLGRRMYQKGLQTFVWKASDPNDDRLQYDISYRREGDTSWKPLKRALLDSLFVWDTTSVPDGTYVVKIAASDNPSNSPGTALVGEKESSSFEVDNTPPRVVFAEKREGSKLRFTVIDEHSPVQKVEYSLEGDRWRVVYPLDGIADSRSEEFEIDLGDNINRSVTVRATDAMNNSSTAVATRNETSPGQRQHE